MTHLQFLSSDSEESRKLIAACEAVNIEPTTRQVSKWRRKIGIAWKVGRIKIKEDKQNEVNN